MSQICYSQVMNEMYADALSTEVARILSARQTELGLSLRQLEERSGVSRMTISRALKGDNAVSVNAFMDIAHALELRAWKVYKEAEDALAGEVIRPSLSVVEATLEGRDLDEIVRKSAALDPGYSPEMEDEQ